MSHRKQTFFGKIGDSLAQTMSKEKAPAAKADEPQRSQDKLRRFLEDIGTFEFRGDELYWKQGNDPKKAPERIHFYWWQNLTTELAYELWSPASMPDPSNPDLTIERDPIDEIFYLMEKVSTPLRELEQKIARGDIRAIDKAELDLIRAHVKHERNTVEQGFPEDLHKEQADRIAKEVEEKLDEQKVKSRAADQVRLNNRRIRLAQEFLGLEHHLDVVSKKFDLVLLNSDMRRLEEEVVATFKLRQNPNIDFDENDKMLLAQERTVIQLRDKIQILGDQLEPSKRTEYLTKLEALQSRIRTAIEFKVTEDVDSEQKVQLLLQKVRNTPRDAAHYEELKDVYQQVKRMQSQLEQRAAKDAAQDQLSARYSRAEMYGASSQKDYDNIDEAREALLEYFKTVPRTATEKEIRDAVLGSEVTQASSTVLAGAAPAESDKKEAPSVRSIATVERFLVEAQMTASMSAAERRDLYQEHKNCRGYVERLQKSLQQAELEMNPADVIDCAKKLDDLTTRLQAQRTEWRHSEYDMTTRVKDKVVLVVTGALDIVSSRWSRFVDSLHHQDHEALERKIDTRIAALRATMAEQSKVLQELQYDSRKLDELQSLIAAAKAAVEQSFHELLRYRAAKGERLQQYEKQKPNRPSHLKSIDAEIASLETQVGEFNQKVAATLEAVRNPVTLSTMPNQAFEMALNKLKNHIFSLHQMKVPPFEAQAEQIPARAEAAYNKAREEFNRIKLDLPLDQMMKFFEVETEFKILHATKTNAVQAEIQRRGVAPSTPSPGSSFNPSNPD